MGPVKPVILPQIGLFYCREGSLNLLLGLCLYLFPAFDDLPRAFCVGQFAGGGAGAERRLQLP